MSDEPTLITVAEAIRLVREAANASDAGAVRNAVAFQAYKGLRPEADADAVRDAFYEVWNEQLRQPFFREPMVDRH